MLVLAAFGYRSRLKLRASMATTKQSSRRSVLKEVAMKCPQRSGHCDFNRPWESIYTRPAVLGG